MDQETPSQDRTPPEGERGTRRPPRRRLGGGWLRELLIPLLAIITAFVLSGIFILITDVQVMNAFARIPRRVAVPFTDPVNEFRWRRRCATTGRRSRSGIRWRSTAPGGASSRRWTTPRPRSRWTRRAPSTPSWGRCYHLPQLFPKAADGPAGGGTPSARRTGRCSRLHRRPCPHGGCRPRVAHGDPSLMPTAFYPITESLVAATPYILVGLARGLGFAPGCSTSAPGAILYRRAHFGFVGYSIRGCRWPSTCR